jgi:hypothetical protein
VAYKADGETHALPVITGGGGDAYADACPCSSVAVGFTGKALSYNGWATYTKVALVCATSSGPFETPAHGSYDPVDPPFTVTCPAGTVLVGQRIGRHHFVSEIHGLCQAPDGGPTFEIEAPLATGVETQHGPSGARCPDGQAVSSVNGRAGDGLDGLGFGCQQLVAVP